MPAVSVVMVACNVDRFLSEAIESILSQTFSDFEFVILDFGSTDETMDVISSYAAADGRIKTHQIPRCSLPEARNTACSYAQGRYIAVMDADDVCLPNRLQLEFDFMESHPDVAIVGGATEWINAEGRSLGIHRVPTEDDSIKRALTVRCPFWHPTVFLRRDAFDLVGGYRRIFTYAHDYDLELRIADRFQVANLKQVVVRYRVHPSQVTFRKQNLQTLCKLAAKVSAASRKATLSDPLCNVCEITTSSLTALGVSKLMQHNAIVSDCLVWMRNLLAAGEYAAVLHAATEILTSKSITVLPWQRADVYLTVAKIHWRRGNVLNAIGAILRAIITRPIIVGRPLKALFLQDHSQ